MPRAPTANELYEIARRALPRFLFEKSGSREALWAAAKIFERVGMFVDERTLQTLISNAHKPWLLLHARDRGTWEQSGESESGLQTRLRTIADAVTVPALEAAVNAVLAEEGISSTCAIVELRQDGAHCSRRASCSRGWRVGIMRPMKFIVILPYGTTPEIAAGISEQVRKLRAGGFPHVIEVRGVP